MTVLHVAAQQSLTNVFESPPEGSIYDHTRDLLVATNEKAGFHKMGRPDIQKLKNFTPLGYMMSRLAANFRRMWSEEWQKLEKAGKANIGRLVEDHHLYFQKSEAEEVLMNTDIPITREDKD